MILKKTVSNNLSEDQKTIWEDYYIPVNSSEQEISDGSNKDERNETSETIKSVIIGDEFVQKVIDLFNEKQKPEFLNSIQSLINEIVQNDRLKLESLIDYLYQVKPHWLTQDGSWDDLRDLTVQLIIQEKEKDSNETVISEQSNEDSSPTDNTGVNNVTIQTPESYNMQLIEKMKFFNENSDNNELKQQIKNIFITVKEDQDIVQNVFINLMNKKAGLPEGQEKFLGKIFKEVFPKDGIDSCNEKESSKYISNPLSKIKQTLECFIQEGTDNTKSEAINTVIKFTKENQILKGEVNDLINSFEGLTEEFKEEVRNQMFDDDSVNNSQSDDECYYSDDSNEF